MIVGTSTNCSAVCGTERTVRGQRDGVEILGTLITCSGTKESRAVRNVNSWSIICGTGTPTRHRQPGPQSAAEPTLAAAPPTAMLAAPPGEVCSVPLGFAQLEHLTLSGPGACPLAPVMCCSTQGHADGLLFMAPP